MLQISIALLFAFAAFASLAVIGQTLHRAWRAAGELRAALAACDTVEHALVRTYAFERREAPVRLRVIRGARTPRAVPAPRALRVAA